MSRSRSSASVSFLALVLTAVLALALPALASAAEYTVNVRSVNTATAGCESPGLLTECTLPGAITAADANPGKDKITFGTIFQGAAPLSSIAIASPLPAISEAVEILGGRCLTGWIPVEGPCVEITGLAAGEGGGNSLTVNASGVTIQGLAIEGGFNGILVGKGATKFTALGDWFGVGLNRTGGTASSGAGIRLEPGADEAMIGGTEATDRNVFNRGGLGLYADGASAARIQGNWFGLRPDGTYQLGSSVSIGVRILDDTRTVPPVKAEDDEIGGTLLKDEAESAECDGACNAFATEDGGADIDLGGYFLVGAHTAAASGPTVIRGNYLGLSVDGTTTISRSESAIYAGFPGAVGETGPGHVTIGGTDAATEGNLIAGGEYGVYSESAAHLKVLGNEFGYTHAGLPTEPAAAAMKIASKGLSEGALISHNSIDAERAAGIESLFAGSEIDDNRIVGGTPGIFTTADDEGVGNLITSNRLEKQERFGIRIENSANVLTGNTVIGANEMGISLSEENGPAEHNRIGGDKPGEANTIEKTGEGSAEEGEGAIVIAGFEPGLNEIAANTGSANEGPFIALYGEHSEEQPNQNIQPPVLATAMESTASGTAQPDATVRIFNKASVEEGELGALLAAVKANGLGGWTATFAKQPIGTLITATQTSVVGGTSMLAVPETAAADPLPPSGGSGTTPSSGDSGTTPPVQAQPLPAAPAPKAPGTKISKGPAKSSKATSAKFKFTATVSGATFECKLDRAKWAKCRSPKSYKKLKPGKHTFQVRALAAGLADASPAKFKFTIKP